MEAGLSTKERNVELLSVSSGFDLTPLPYLTMEKVDDEVFKYMKLYGDYDAIILDENFACQLFDCFVLTCANIYSNIFLLHISRFVGVLPMHIFDQPLRGKTSALFPRVW